MLRGNFSSIFSAKCKIHTKLIINVFNKLLGIIQIILVYKYFQFIILIRSHPVSYTHLDVYKRQVLYNLVEPTDDHFNVDTECGVIYLVKPLDRETKEDYLLTMNATDQGVPHLWTLVSVQVIILDINDNPPEFVQHFYNTTVFENATHGISVITEMCIRDRYTVI